MDYWKIFLILFITIILLNKSSICNSMLGGNQTPTAPTSEESTPTAPISDASTPTAPTSDASTPAAPPVLVLDAFEKQHKSVYKLVNTEKDKAELETQTLITELKSNLDEYKTKNDEKLENLVSFGTSFNNDWDDFEKEVEKKDIIIEKIKRTILKVENDPNKAVNLQYFKCINDNIKNIISNKNISKKDESTKIKEIAKSCFNMKVNSSGLSEVSNNQELVDSLKSSLSKDTNLVKCSLQLLKEKYDIQSSTNLCNTDTLNITTGGNSASNYDLSNSLVYQKVNLILINKTLTDNHQFINNQSSIDKYIVHIFKEQSKI